MTHLLVWYDKSAKARRKGLPVQPIGRFTLTEAEAATELDRTTLANVANGSLRGLQHGKFWLEGERK